MATAATEAMIAPSTFVVRLIVARCVGMDFCRRLDSDTVRMGYLSVNHRSSTERRSPSAKQLREARRDPESDACPFEHRSGKRTRA